MGSLTPPPTHPPGWTWSPLDPRSPLRTFNPELSWGQEQIEPPGFLRTVHVRKPPTFVFSGIQQQASVSTPIFCFPGALRVSISLFCSLSLEYFT